MNIRSILTIRVHSGQREAAATAFMQRRVLEECAEAVPGYIHGELLLSVEDPDLLTVVVHWDSKAAVQQWWDCPVRQAQNTDLLSFVAESPISRVYEAYGKYSRP